ESCGFECLAYDRAVGLVLHSGKPRTECTGGTRHTGFGYRVAYQVDHHPRTRGGSRWVYQTGRPNVAVQFHTVGGGEHHGRPGTPTVDADEISHARLRFS
ncbi:MAG: hypothetical protein AAFU38_02755, partial [Bacteroidota bacterium]